jgi:hypothetical protein
MEERSAESSWTASTEPRKKTPHTVPPRPRRLVGFESSRSAETATRRDMVSERGLREALFSNSVMLWWILGKRVVGSWVAFS